MSGPLGLRRSSSVSQGNQWKSQALDGQCIRTLTLGLATVFIVLYLGPFCIASVTVSALDHPALSLALLQPLTFDHGWLVPSKSRGPPDQGRGRRSHNGRLLIQQRNQKCTSLPVALPVLQLVLPAGAQPISRGVHAFACTAYTSPMPLALVPASPPALDFSTFFLLTLKSSEFSSSWLLARPQTWIHFNLRQHDTLDLNWHPVLWPSASEPWPLPTWQGIPVTHCDILHQK